MNLLARGVVEVAGRLVGQQQLPGRRPGPGRSPPAAFRRRRARAGLCVSRCAKPDHFAAARRPPARCRRRAVAKIRQARSAIISGASTFSERRQLGQQVIELKDHAEVSVAQQVALARRAGCRSGGRRSGSRRLAGASSVPSRCSSVLLPEPLWPTIARNSPWRTCKIDAAQHGDLDGSLAVALVQSTAAVRTSATAATSADCREQSIATMSAAVPVQDFRERPRRVGSYSYRSASTGCSLARAAGRQDAGQHGDHHRPEHDPGDRHAARRSWESL